MIQPLRDTKYARELVSARLPSGTAGASVALERLFIKGTGQVEIRFSWWEGSRMMPRPLDLPEEELLPLLAAAVEAGVFSDDFVAGLRRLLGEGPGAEAGPAPASADASTAKGGPEPPTTAPLSELEQVQLHFHQLVRTRAGAQFEPSAPLPVLVPDTPTEASPGWLSIEPMGGGFRYWWDPRKSGLRLICESGSDSVPGSGQLHEILAAGARLLGEGF
jgi:hypothetical protein